MRKSEHITARVLTLLGAVAAVLYLGWRVVASFSGAAAWLSAPLLVAEVAGFAGTGLLAWALWPSPVPRRTIAAGSFDTTVGEPVDVVVRVVDQELHEIRATLLSLRAVDRAGDVLVVDHSGRPEVVTLAAEFQCMYAATDLDDANGLRVMHAAVRTPQFLLLDAGDVPSHDIVVRLAVDLADPAVAVVQGLGVSLAAESPEHGPHCRHELAFERSSLNPALGRRGLAVWLGSGSLVRTDALREVPMGAGSAVEAHWNATAALHRAGWSVVAPADATVVGHRTMLRDIDVYHERVQRTRAARLMLTGEHGALRGTTGGVAPRLAALAWAVRPLSSFRRVAMVAVLCAALLAGELPMQVSPVAMFALWAPAFVYGSLGICLLSGWTLRPGDRTRWSLHNIGAAFTSLRTAESVEATADRSPIFSLPSSQYGPSLVVVVVALSVVLTLRGLSEQFTHALGVLPHAALLAMLLSGLWLLALSLDVLRVLARRSVWRRAERVGTDLVATLHHELMTVVDITPLGAGLVGMASFDVGEYVPMHVSVPSRTGVTDLALGVVVRNVSVSPAGEWRVGVEFIGIDDAAANALAEFCTIEPVWEAVGSMPGVSVLEARPIPGAPAAVPNAGRATLRVMSTLALAGALASALPSAASASDGSPSRMPIDQLPMMSVVVLTVVGGIAVTMFAGLVRPVIRPLRLLRQPTSR
ncbi:MAG: hypothetical protein RLZ14_731 [Actinomycetota bacterium]